MVKFEEIEIGRLFMPVDRDVVYRKVSRNEGRLQIIGIVCDFSSNAMVREYLMPKSDCQHLNRVGDNYGESCRDCGEQLSGYGWGGWFGSNLTGNETCIHLFVPIGDSDDSGKMCIYCQKFAV